MEDEVVKPVVTIARYQDRIPTDKSPEEAASLHGAGNVFVDGKCYRDILAGQAQPADPIDKAPADEAPPEVESDAPAVEPAGKVSE